MSGSIIKNLSVKSYKNIFLFFFVILQINFQTTIFPKEEENSQSNYLFSKNNEHIFSGNANNYLLGPGDGIYVLLQSIPEYSGYTLIGPDGNLNIPGTAISIYAEGLTKSELQKLIMKEHSEFIINPNTILYLINYRPIRVYVKGEVSRPGLYTLRGMQKTQLSPTDIEENNFPFNNLDSKIENRYQNIQDNLPPLRGAFNLISFPTVYDALTAAQGITPYSEISNIKVIRRIRESDGGGKMMTKLNFLNLFKDGDLSQNIRIFDQDVIVVTKSDQILTDQLIEANSSNLSPDFVSVFVTGNVVKAGQTIVPNGAGLNQALAIAGGDKLLTGNVEFLRYNEGGLIEKRKFNIKKTAKLDSYQNPILKRGDIINLNRSILGQTSDILKEVVSPVVNSYTLYKIFTD